MVNKSSNDEGLRELALFAGAGYTLTNVRIFDIMNPY